MFSNKRYSWFLVVFYGVVWCQTLLFLALQNWFIPFLCFQANLNLDMEIKKLETSVWFDNVTAHYKKIVSTDPHIFLLIMERFLTRLNSSIFLKYKFLIYTNVRLWRIWFSLLMDRPDWMFWNHSFWLVFDLLPIWENEVSPFLSIGASLLNFFLVWKTARVSDTLWVSSSEAIWFTQSGVAANFVYNPKSSDWKIFQWLHWCSQVSLTFVLLNWNWIEVLNFPAQWWYVAFQLFKSHAVLISLGIGSLKLRGLAWPHSERDERKRSNFGV